jgi:hypothetical protein
MTITQLFNQYEVDLHAPIPYLHEQKKSNNLFEKKIIKKYYNSVFI